MIASVVEPAAETLTGTALAFSDGLFGFPESREFSLTCTAYQGLFWLQSQENPALGFVLLDPFAFFDDYTVDLSDLDIARLQPRSSTDIAVLVIVTLGATADSLCSVNLQGPVAFNVETGIARQVIQPERATRVPVALHFE